MSTKTRRFGSSYVANVRIVEIAKCIEFPILLLDSNEELLDAFKSQLITLDQDSDWVGHELGRHLKHVVRQGSREDDDLSGGREVSVDVVDLVLESLVQQLVRLVKHKHLRSVDGQLR